jgi:delta 1-pyrroline-5-carboxylate dehydrogenase
MRNREAALRKIDQIDSSLNKVLGLLRRNDEQGFNEAVENMREQIDQLRTYIETERIDGYEMNTSAQ